MSREDKQSWAEGPIDLCFETNCRSVCVCVTQVASSASGLFQLLTRLLAELVN